MEKEPWYKRAAIWCVLAGAMVVGACILVWRKIQWTLIPSSFPAGKYREARDQKLKADVDEIEKEIEKVIDEKQTIDHDSPIDNTDAHLARARERRRIAALWPRDRRAGGNDDGDQSD